MKKDYESPELEFMKVNFINNVLGDSRLPPEQPGGDDVDPGPGGFGDDNF